MSGERASACGGPARQGPAAGRAARPRAAARLPGALLLAALALLGPACGGGGAGTPPVPGAGERSSLLVEVLARSAVESYGRTAVVSRQPRDRFLREVLVRAGVIEEARRAGLPFDLLVDSYVATAGAGSAAGMELLDVGDASAARSLAAVLAAGDTPSHRCARAEAPIAEETGWILTCTAAGTPGRQLFIAVVATERVVVIAQESGPRVDHVAAALVRNLREARGGE